MTSHEPEEAMIASIDEVFQEADASQRRWREWEQHHQLKSVRLHVPEDEYQV